jgi:hypothetical protein
MSRRGIDFLENWLRQNVTDADKQGIRGDAASLAIEMAERLIADAAKAGLGLDDLESEFGTSEIIIREALESSEGSPGD